MRLKDKVALITGAAQGIGKEIAVTLSNEGAKIIVADINLQLSEETSKELRTESAPLALDVSDFDQVEKNIKNIAGNFGRIDILVNNAGIVKDALFLRMKKEDWDRVLKVNLDGAFNVCKAVVPFMVKQRSGKIINISSIIGEMGNIGQSNYAASKAGLIGFTKSLAREVAARNITVNAVAPGYIDTEMTKKLPEDVKEKMLQLIPVKRLGTTGDVANAVLFLASPEADYITGQVINVNGGMYM
jgi:3-oxoacyl-[acyl-carrier protein] reductase